jgi:hypothetical protein
VRIFGFSHTASLHAAPKMHTRFLTAALAIAATGCASAGRPAASGAVERAAAAAVTQEVIARHTVELASDRYEGRFPGTRGEELAVGYIEGEMRRLGLAPGNPDGTYVQRLELVAQRSRAAGTLTIAGRAETLSIPGQAAFAAARPVPQTRVRDSELVFAGYGISAPEYGWDDYAGVDVRGKTVLILRGEPEPRLADDTARLDPALFRGPQLTVHATIEHKRAVAQRHGAVAVVQLPGMAGGFPRVAQRLGGEIIALGTEPWPPVLGAISPELKARIFAAAGRTFSVDSAAAGRAGFRAVPLGATLSLDVTSELRRIPTRNVIGRLEGSDPRLRGEYVIFSAHWDAFGIGPAVDGDSIYNGAVDDAVGVGQMLAVAQALAAMRVRPRRTVLFLATSAEEHGLLGARHYAANPLYPLERTLADINFDIVYLAGQTRDVTMFGHGRSTLDEMVAAAARLQDRTVEGERAPQIDTWFYQDHFAFVEAGVPSLSVAAGNDVIGRPPGYAEERAAEYRASHYHRPSDEVRGDWDWGSIVQDAQLGVLLGLRIANGNEWPAWKPGAEFADRRPRP